MVANKLPTDTPLTQGVGSKGQTISFSETSHVAYQIKGNLAQSTMKANMLSLHTPTTPWVGSKGHFFFFSKSGQTISFSETSHVAYQIKGNLAQSTMKANMLSLHTPTTPGVGSKGHFFFFSKSGHDHFKLKWKKCRPTCKVTL